MYIHYLWLLLLVYSKKWSCRYLSIYCWHVWSEASEFIFYFEWNSRGGQQDQNKHSLRIGILRNNHTIFWVNLIMPFQRQSITVSNFQPENSLRQLHRGKWANSWGCSFPLSAVCWGTISPPSCRFHSSNSSTNICPLYSAVVFAVTLECTSWRSLSSFTAFFPLCWMTGLWWAIVESTLRQTVWANRQFSAPLTYF